MGFWMKFTKSVISANDLKEDINELIRIVRFSKRTSK